MILTFTERKATNTALVDDDGKVMYQTRTVKSPFRKTSIYRGPIAPENTTTDRESQIERPEDSDGEDEQPISDSDSNEIARIHWRTFNKSRIVYGMKITNVDKIIQKIGPGFLKPSFTFTGPDGKQYIWDLGKNGKLPGVLKLNDDSNTVIAKLHRKMWSLTGEKRLEIFSTDVIDWLDFVIVTFIYTESVRADREGIVPAGKTPASGADL